MKKIKILESAVFFPDEIVKSDDLMEEIGTREKYGIPTNWISRVVGIHERRVGRPDATPVSHAMPAVTEVLDKTDIDPDKIGLVIFCGIERENDILTTANIICDKAGLKNARSFDISNACFGFYEGIDIANTLIACEQTEYALIVTGEVSSQVMYQAVKNLKAGMEKRDAKNIIGALTVGDAGGAVLLGPSESDSGFNLFTRETDSSHTQKCIYRKNEAGVFEGQMLMGEISKVALDMQIDLINETMNKLALTDEPWVISHQMGKPPFEKLRESIGIAEQKMVKTYPNFGNLTSATFAANWSVLNKELPIERGQSLIGCFAGSGIVVGQFGYTL